MNKTTNERRVNTEILRKYLETQNIPKVITFENLKEGRPEMFKVAIEEANKIEGLYLEFGVMSGGTTNQIAKLIPNKILYGFDSWKGITEDFSEIHKKGTWIERPRISEKNIEIIEGFYQNTLEPFLQKYPEKIAFIHNSSSIYSSTKYMLDTIAKNNRFQIGTIIQFDTMFYQEGNYWYQDEFLAWNEIQEQYKIESEYLAWAGFCHCAYKITKI